jgi:hypothetical protein
VASRPRFGWSLALHLGLGAVGCAAGGLFGALLAGVAAYSYQREFRDGPLLLSRVLPAPASLNVVGCAGARKPRQRVVLSAHLDGAQAGWLFSERVADFFAGRSRRGAGGSDGPRGPHALPRALLFAAAGLALASWLGASGLLMATARAAVTVLLAAGAAAGLEWGLARPSPGANDNASGVAALLTCAEQLLAQLPEDTELWIVATGAGEVGACGMRAFCDAHSDWRADSTCFVNFESVGGGSLHWVRSEGTLDRVEYPPLLRELARRVAASGVFGEVKPTDLLAGSDGRVPARRGHPTLTLVSLEPNGVPRHYHRPDDLPEALDMATVIRSADFAAAVAWAALRGEAGPLAIV